MIQLLCFPGFPKSVEKSSEFGGPKNAEKPVVDTQDVALRIQGFFPTKLRAPIPSEKNRNVGGPIPFDLDIPGFLRLNYFVLEIF